MGNLMLQEEVYSIKENLRKSFNDGQWLACQDYLWLEEGESFALQELQIKNSVSPPKLIENLIDVEGKGNKNNTSLKEQYWELSVASRLISLAFQKWMGSIVAMVSTWSAIRCAFWFSNAPTWYGIFMFLIPLLIIPVLSSAYAEVNYEGGLIPRSIYPTEERLQIFQYISEQPIVMNVYNHTVSYSTIGTVVVGILAAFASKILLQEMNYL